VILMRGLLQDILAIEHVILLVGHTTLVYKILTTGICKMLCNRPSKRRFKN